MSDPSPEGVVTENRLRAAWRGDVKVSIRLDPWGHYIIEDYVRLINEFGLEPIDKIEPLLPIKHRFIERRIIFAHRDLDTWLKGLLSSEKSIVLTGFMPSGQPHLGTAMVFEELKLFQSMGAYVKIVIADAEAYSVRREDRRELIERGAEFVAHAIAWGVDPQRAEFYYQTAMKPEYYRLIQMFSRKVSMAEMEAIYGEINPAKIVSSLTQVADILHPQLEEFGGYRNVLVPVGVDQDPHIRLARDIADRFTTELELRRPSSIYHKLLRGLDGNKMSKSRPEYAIHLSDDPTIAVRKLMNALTGGRATSEEQRRLGGEPWKCMVFELYMYHLADSEAELKEVYDNCVNGRVLCGECKRRAGEKLVTLLKEHQRRVADVKSSKLVEKILVKPSF